MTSTGKHDPLSELDPEVNPDRTACARVLRGGGAPQGAIEHVRLWTCLTCMRRKQPDSPWPLQNHQPMEFNDQVCIDLLTIRDSEGDMYTVLSMVDTLSRYHTAVLVKDKKPQTAARAFSRFLFRWAGTPGRKLADQGGRFQGAFNDLLLECLSADMHVAAIGTGWQSGDGAGGGDTGEEPVGLRSRIQPRPTRARTECPPYGGSSGRSQRFGAALMRSRARLCAPRQQFVPSVGHRRGAQKESWAMVAWDAGLLLASTREGSTTAHRG